MTTESFPAGIPLTPSASSIPVDMKWYALYTRPRHEKKLAFFLELVGIVRYLPLKRVKRKWSDRVKFVEEPLFKSYIFVHLDYRLHRFIALNQPGAVSFVRFEGQPAVLPDDVIESLRILEDNARSLETAPAASFAAGDEVLITQGPFKGARAHVERRKNQNRVILRLPFLDQVVFADVEAWDIEKA